MNGKHGIRDCNERNKVFESQDSLRTPLMVSHVTGASKAKQTDSGIYAQL